VSPSRERESEGFERREGPAWETEPHQLCENSILRKYPQRSWGIVQTRPTTTGTRLSPSYKVKGFNSRAASRPRGGARVEAEERRWAGAVVG
jgi:hypothetical protein